MFVRIAEHKTVTIAQSIFEDPSSYRAWNRGWWGGGGGTVFCVSKPVNVHKRVRMWLKKIKRESRAERAM